MDIINKMRFPRYGLGQDDYIEHNPTEKLDSHEITILENLGRAGVQLKGFARTNLFKRLESNGYAFLLSVSRQLLRNHLFLYAIENNKPLPVGKQETAIVDDFLFLDTDDDISIKILDTEKKYREKAKEFYSALIQRVGRVDRIG